MEDKSKVIDSGASGGNERVGAVFDIERMRQASARSWQGIALMREHFQPGMRESEATTLAEVILRELGMERMWHPVHVRFGSNTTKIYREKSDGDPILGDDDIFFIDIGPVFDGHEGDVGATFVTGIDPEKTACAAAAKTLFDDVSEAWRTQHLAGPALYDFAATRARHIGWKLNLDIKGHRVSDFPHAIHRGGDLGDFEKHPAPGVWILEIQIVHPTQPFGAFYEDLLI